MKKIYAFVFCFFSGWRKFIIEKKLIILKLQADLRGLHFATNRLEALVKLFQIIDQFQSKQRFDCLISSLEQRNYGQLSGLTSSLQNLQKAIDEIWKNGINQTIPSKKPDAETIYMVGNFKGFHRRSVGYFFKNQEELEEEILPANPNELPVTKTTSWSVATEQASTFVTSSADKLLKELAVIEDWL